MKEVKKHIFIIILVLISAFSFTACTDSGKDSEKSSYLISASIHNVLEETKFHYYRYEPFSPSKTFVDLKYYDKSQNKQIWLTAFSLPALTGIINVDYTVEGFDSSVIQDNQKITITFTSPTLGEVSATFNIFIIEEVIVDIEIADETLLKKQYMLNEDLSYSEIPVNVKYSNGLSDTVPLDSSWVHGFDTSTVSASERRMYIIAQASKAKYYNYTVSPGPEYDLFSTSYLQCFFPSTDSGYEKTSGAGVTKYTKNGIAEVQIRTINNFYDASPSEHYIQLRFGAVSITKPVLDIISYENSVHFNGDPQTSLAVTGTVCVFKKKSGADIYTGIYIRNNQNVLTEILLINIQGEHDAEINVLFDTVKNFVSR